MRDYRLYCFDAVGDIQLPEKIRAATDDEAILKARRMTPGARIREIWLNNRLVARTANHDLAVA